MTLTEKLPHIKNPLSCWNSEEQDRGGTHFFWKWGGTTMERKCFPSYTFIGSAVTFGETGDDFFYIKGSEGSKGGWRFLGVPNEM